MIYRPPRGPPPANVETKPAEPKAPEPKPQMPRPPPNRTAPIAPTRPNVVQATTTTSTTPPHSVPPPRPPPISGRPPLTKEQPKEPVKEPVQEIEQPSLNEVKTMADDDIFGFDDFVDFDQAIKVISIYNLLFIFKETKAPKPKETTPASSQPVAIPSGPPLPAKTVAAVDDFASALDELDSFDFDVTPTPKTASSSSPPKSFTPTKSNLSTSPAATKPLQATPRPISTFTTPVTVVDSPPKVAPIYTPKPTLPPNNPPPVAVPPPTTNTVNSSPPPRAAPPPRPATPTQANNANYRKSVRFDAYKQPVAVQERGNSVKDAWLQKLQNFEQDYNGTIMFTTNDDATMKDASRKMVNLCNPNKEGKNFIVETSF